MSLETRQDVEAETSAGPAGGLGCAEVAVRVALAAAVAAGVVGSGEPAGFVAGFSSFWGISSLASLVCFCSVHLGYVLSTCPSGSRCADRNHI